LILGTSEFYAPLGVGHHHDHVEVALAVMVEMLALNKMDRVRFYEDPYASGEFCRRAHFVTRRGLWKLRHSPALASPRMGLLSTGAALCAKGPPIEAYIPEAISLEWSFTNLPVDQQDEHRKLMAVAEYTSQVKASGGVSAVNAFIRQTHVAVNGEPYWQAHPKQL